MEVDHYIDWQVARAMLLDTWEETSRMIRLCNIMLAKAGTIHSGDELFNELIQNVDLTDEQVEQISTAYLDGIAKIKFTTSTLGGGEVNHEE